jgi:hypothetical protein
MTELSDYDFSKLVFKKNKNNYKIFYPKHNELKRVLVQIPNIHIRFGIEKYKFKEIINLELLRDNNEMHNLIAKLKSLDVFMLNLAKSDEFNNILGNREYISCFKHKYQHFNPNLRTTTRKVKNNRLTKFIINNKEIDEKLIKGSTGMCVVELDSLWVSENSYGLTWFINYIDFSKQKI